MFKPPTRHVNKKKICGFLYQPNTKQYRQYGGVSASRQLASKMVYKLCAFANKQIPLLEIWNTDSAKVGAHTMKVRSFEFLYG